MILRPISSGKWIVTDTAYGLVPNCRETFLWTNHRSNSLAHIYQALISWLNRVTHICVSKLTIIGSDNGLLPGRRPAIIWTNAGILLIEPLRTNLSEILIHAFSFTKMHMKMSSGKWRPFCLGLDVLTQCDLVMSGILVSESQVIPSITIIYSTVYSGADQRNIKAPRHWLLCGEFTGDQWIPRTKASKAENVSIWWRHHVLPRLMLTCSNIGPLKANLNLIQINQLI